MVLLRSLMSDAAGDLVAVPLASFFIGGPGIATGKDLGEVDMRSLAPTLAKVLGVSFPSAE